MDFLGPVDSGGISLVLNASGETWLMWTLNVRSAGGDILRNVDPIFLPRESATLDYISDPSTQLRKSSLQSLCSRSNHPLIDRSDRVSE